MYARVTDNQIDATGWPAATLRNAAGQWVSAPNGQWTDEQLADFGWLPVVDAPRPADTVTHTYERSVTLVGGVPTETWTQVAKPVEQVNRQTVTKAIANALVENRTIIDGADAYVASHITLPASPTTAQVTAAVKAYGVQVRALTIAAGWAAKQRNGLIRLAINQLDATD